MTHRNRRRFFTRRGAGGEPNSADSPVIRYLTGAPAATPGRANHPPNLRPPLNPGLSPPAGVPLLPNPNFILPFAQNYGFQFPCPQIHPLQVPGLHPFNAPPVALDRVESATAKAHQDIAAAGENVTAWKVSQAVLLHLKVDSWSNLGIHMQDIPSLRALLVTEGKVSAFIHCFVGARRITSVYDLELELLNCEGVDRFEKLGLGPLCRHPLIQHYFSTPSHATDVFKITTQDIIHYLFIYMGKSKRKKRIDPDDLLDYIVGLKSVSCKGDLGIRIQSLGSLIRYLRQAKKAEMDSLTASTINHCHGMKASPETSVPLCSTKKLSDKQSFDARFESISKRVECFTSEWGSSHVRFANSDTDDDDDGCCYKGGEECLNTPQCRDSDNSAGVQRVSTCPYPSTTEELMRLGKKNEASDRPCSDSAVKGSESSGRKRKLDEYANNDCVDLKVNRKIKLHCVQSLASSEVDKFVTTWKEACWEHDITKVIQMMVDFYCSKNKKSLRSAKVTFSSYFGIMLLNIAVKSIKCGMLDSLYDTIQPRGDCEADGQRSCPSDEMLDIGPTVKTQLVLHSNDGIKAPGCDILDDEIVKKVSNYIESDTIGHRESNLSFKYFFALLKLIQQCERWLIGQYSVQSFECLGRGNFFDFLERHSSLLPNKMLNFFSGVQSKHAHVDVFMHQRQVQVMLSQAEGNFSDKGCVTESFFGLLRRQFPTMSFHLGGNPEKNSLELIKELKIIDNSSCVVFSTTLLGKQSGTNLTSPIQEKYHSTISTDDAVGCLLRAPMLSDILSWSHWDLNYAPSLGSLLEWLLCKVEIKELLCIATIDGKLLRIDHCATADEFLVSLVECSPFHVALNLLSLLAIYKGIHNAPVSLLKCYTQRAIEVILRNHVEDPRKYIQMENLFGGKPLEGQHHFDKRCSLLDHSSGSRGTSVLVRQSEDVSSYEKAFSFVSRLILDCLGYVPSEFRSFVMDILVSGLRAFNHHANSTILQQCKHMDERTMLHGIGFSLGITEWINDFRGFSSNATTDLLISSRNRISSSEYLSNISGALTRKTSKEHVSSNHEVISTFNDPPLHEVSTTVHAPSEDVHEVSGVVHEGQTYNSSSVGFSKGGDKALRDAAFVVESIRREEFGLDINLNSSESSLLLKQHARLGRALHCLSQELYSQDSHLLLELIQNADDNCYPENVDPTLVFVLQDTGIAVINNEHGFSAQNIRALCDIGNSTKKGGTVGYIGHKGIGFKSVFRVTDAPEIHSNGFHVKFDITEGQIGFILPTVIPSFDMNLLQGSLTGDVDLSCSHTWNTCISLPFRSTFKDGPGLSAVMRMFGDLHPSLLLFLHRLRCIKFKNMLDNSFMDMRKAVLDNGIVKVSHGNDTTCWLVVSTELNANIVRPEVQTTEISMAFTLQESEDGKYEPVLGQQPVFAFLPLRTYGLKFIIQGDFVLPSSREEVDGNSAWNQWLLSEIPQLFVIAEQSFCALPCFQENPGKAVTTYLSFVPLFGEVHGFFSPLPSMIISNLRISNCLLLDGPELEWVLPCRVLRGWDEQFRLLIPDDMIKEHVGLCYLNKNIILSDALANALGVQECGPKVLVDILNCICRANGETNSISLDWLSSCLSSIYLMLTVQSLGRNFHGVGSGCDLINCLRKIPFVPLSDGSYSSVNDGPIWLPCNSYAVRSGDNFNANDFPHLYVKLRMVNPLLVSGTASNTLLEVERSGNVMRMLRKIGVQDLSAHEVIRSHVLVALTDDRHVKENTNLLVDYLAFIMLHFQFDCPLCRTEKGEIISELRNRSTLLTNYGLKCPGTSAIHFSKEFGNPFDIDRLIERAVSIWCEVDTIYLKHPVIGCLSNGLAKWRNFFMELGVTDFVRIASVRKDVPRDIHKNMEGLMLATSYFDDWESPELLDLLSILSAECSRERSIYLMEVFEKMWDTDYRSKARVFVVSSTSEIKEPIQSSFMKSIQQFRWISSTLDKKLHYSTDLFYDCEEVRSVLGDFAPYAVMQGTSRLLLEDIGFKTNVSVDDAVKVFCTWKMLGAPCLASIAQMTKFYTLIADGIRSSQLPTIKEFISSAYIFIPSYNTPRYNAVVRGTLFFPNKVYWHDPTGCMEMAKEFILSLSKMDNEHILSEELATLYPGLHDFFVNICGAPSVPSFGCYFETLLQLSIVALPSQSTHVVFKIFLKLSGDLSSGLTKPEEITFMKDNLLKQECTILPTLQDKWVSLHPSFGVICWPDDDELKKQFRHFEGLDLLHFGELNSMERDLYEKVALLLQNLGIPRLSEIVFREAIFYGTDDGKEKIALINWVLPYVQCYLYKLHHDRYLELKQLGFEKLRKLQVIVVEKLFYKHTLKRSNQSSRKRIECNALLQGNVLYVANASDYHSIFLELSRFFFEGTSELQLANFLHMITTMAESGSTNAQIEFFMENSQKVPSLPAGEAWWFISSLSPLGDNENSIPPVSGLSTNMRESSTSEHHLRKPGIVVNWPPTDWKTAPDFHYAHKNHLLTNQNSATCYHTQKQHRHATTALEVADAMEDLPISIEIGEDFVIEETPISNSNSSSTVVLEALECCSPEPHGAGEMQISSCLERISEAAIAPDVAFATGDGSSSFGSDYLSLHAPSDVGAHSRRTGRLGELLAHRYLVQKLGHADVTWVNEGTETGLPFDIIVKERGENKEFVEVKATRVAKKNWFSLSTREWQFAAEKGDAYSICHVFLHSNDKKATITLLRNPVKLCQQNVLHLALLMSPPSN